MMCWQHQGLLLVKGRAFGLESRTLLAIGVLGFVQWGQRTPLLHTAVRTWRSLGPKHRSSYTAVTLAGALGLQSAQGVLCWCHILLVVPTRHVGLQ
jgi:hypothetical protein